MGMGTAPVCGYILPVAKLKKELEKTLANEMEESDLSFEDLLTEYSYDQAKVEFQVNGQKVEAWVYVHSDGDCYDDLDEGEMYLIFSEDYLFNKQKTDAGQFLESQDLFPEFAMWTCYG